MITVLVVDDCTLFRQGLVHMLTAQRGIKVVGEAANGQQALVYIQKLKPQVVLLDEEMPEMCGTKMLELLKKQSYIPKVIMVSCYSRQGEYVESFITSGATGCVSKDIDQDGLVEAIHTIIKDETYFEPSCYWALQEHLKQKHRLKKIPKNVLSFDDKDQQIVIRAFRGQSNKEIGKALFMAKRTVEGRRSRMIKAVGGKKIINVLEYALSNDMLPLEMLLKE